MNPMPTGSMNPHYAHVREYLAFCRQAFLVTSQGGRIRLSWAGSALDASGWRRSFRLALHRRINAKGEDPRRGRKLEDLYQVEMARDRDRIQAGVQHRVRIHQIATPELRRRFSHLLSRREED